MKITAKMVLDIAANEIGYIGKKNKTDDTSVKEAPNGKGKFNKYSRDLEADVYFNSPKDGADFCAIGVSWAFWKAANGSKEEATQVQPLAAGGCGAGVKYAHDAYAPERRGAEPHIGAQIFYKDSAGYWAHTGLVEAVAADGTITTIEWNWKNEVVRRYVKRGETYGTDGQSIADFAYPYYDAPDPEPVKPSEDWVTVAQGDTWRFQVDVTKLQK